MVAAGAGHTVLLRSGGSAVARGDNMHGQCDLPALAAGQAYTHVAAGMSHTVLLRSDGTAVACGSNRYGQCSLPAPGAGQTYTRVAAGACYTVLLRSDGAAVACGDNMHGQCDLPALDAGQSYRDAAAGMHRTVLLRSDGAAVACGDNRYGQCNLPALAACQKYSNAAAAGSHTVLLRSDGAAVACGDNRHGQCNLPALASRQTYKHVAAKAGHTVLLRSDGTAVACGDNRYGQCNLPALVAGLKCRDVAAGGAHTVLLRCDGTAVACGHNKFGQCNLTAVVAGHTYMPNLVGRLDSEKAELQQEANAAAEASAAELQQKTDAFVDATAEDEALRARLGMLQSEKTELQQQSNAASEVKAMEEALAAQISRLKSDKSEIEEMATAREEALAAQVSRLESEKSELQQAASACADAEVLRAQLGMLESEKMELQQLGSAASEANAAEEALEARVSGMESEKHELRQQAEALAEAAAAEEALRAQLGRLEVDQSELLKRHADATAEAEAMEEALAAKVRGLEADNAELQRQVRALEDALAAHLSRPNPAESELQQTSDACAEATAAAKALRAQLGRLEDDQAESQQQASVIAVATAAEKALGAQIGRLGSEKAEGQLTAMAREEVFASQVSRLEDERAELRQTANACAEAKAREEVMAAQISRLESERAELHQKADACAEAMAAEEILRAQLGTLEDDGAERQRHEEAQATKVGELEAEQAKLRQEARAREEALAGQLQRRADARAEAAAAAAPQPPPGGPRAAGAARPARGGGDFLDDEGAGPEQQGGAAPDARAAEEEALAAPAGRRQSEGGGAPPATAEAEAAKPKLTRGTTRRRVGVATESIDSGRVKTYVKPVFAKDRETITRLEAKLREDPQMQVLFGHLDPTGLRDVVNAFQPKEILEGVDIQLLTGDPGDCLYFIKDGSVDVFVARPGPAGVAAAGGRGPKVTTLGSGALFGELALLYNTPRAATVTAASERVDTWRLDALDFKMLRMQSSQEQYEKYEGWLSKVDLLKTLNHYELSRLADAMESHRFSPGDTIIRQGDMGDRFFILESGSAAAYMQGDDGEKEVHRYSTTGDYFGEVALLTAEPRRATVRAVAEGCTAASLVASDFANLLGPLGDMLREQADRSATGDSETLPPEAAAALGPRAAGRPWERLPLACLVAAGAPCRLARPESAGTWRGEWAAPGPRRIECAVRVSPRRGDLPVRAQGLPPALAACAPAPGLPRAGVSCSDLWPTGFPPSWGRPAGCGAAVGEAAAGLSRGSRCPVQARAPRERGHLAGRVGSSGAAQVSRPACTPAAAATARRALPVQLGGPEGEGEELGAAAAAAGAEDEAEAEAEVRAEAPAAQAEEKAELPQRVDAVAELSVSRTHSRRQPGQRFPDQAVVSLSSAGKERSEPLRAPSGLPVMRMRSSSSDATAEHRKTCVPVLHPEHPRLLMWNFVGVVFLVYIVFMLPYELSFGACESRAFFVVASIVDVYYILDMVASFLTGYEDDETKEIVMDPCRIASRYLRCWFYLDFLAAIPWDWMDSSRMPYLQSSKALRALRIARVVRCARLFRLGLLGSRLEMFIEENPGLGFALGVLKVLFLLVFVTHCSACVWFLIGSLDGGELSWVNKHLDNDIDSSKAYVYSLYFTLTTMTTVGYGDIVATNFNEVCFVLLLLLLASVVFASLMGELTDLIRALNRKSHNLGEHKQKLAQYMRWRRLPKAVAIPLRAHLVWLWETGAGYDDYEQEVKGCLSPVLRRELAYHIYGRMLRNAPFLQWIRMYEPCLKEMTVLLSSGFLSPGDKLFRVGEPNDQIFMMQSGQVRLTMNDSIHDTAPQQQSADLAYEGVRKADLTRKAASVMRAASRSSSKTSVRTAADENASRSMVLQAFHVRKAVTEFDAAGGAKTKQASRACTFSSEVFRLATKELREHEARLSWCARMIQTSWRKRKNASRSNSPRRPRAGTAHSAVQTTPISAPAYFGEACLWHPIGDWETSAPDTFAYSARCESQVEVVYMKRTVVKAILDKFSPWLEDRFEVFRQAVVRGLPTKEAAAGAPPVLSEGSGAQWPPAAASDRDGPPTLPPRPRQALLDGQPVEPPAPQAGPGVDWNAAWNLQAWNRCPGERLVTCVAIGGPTSGSVRLKHASSVNAEWDGTGSYEEAAVLAGSPAAGAAFGAISAAIEMGVSTKCLTSLVAAAVRGAVQGAAATAAAEDKIDPLDEVQAVVNLVGDIAGVERTVKDAKEVLSSLGAPGRAVAGRLGRASRYRNATAHPACAGLAAAAGQVIASAGPQLKQGLMKKNSSIESSTDVPESEDGALVGSVAADIEVKPLKELSKGTAETAQQLQQQFTDLQLKMEEASKLLGVYRVQSEDSNNLQTDAKEAEKVETLTEYELCLVDSAMQKALEIGWECTDELRSQFVDRVLQRERGYCTVREPAKGFFLTGSSIEDLNGIYCHVKLSSLLFERRPQIAYRNERTGWFMVLQAEWHECGEDEYESAAEEEQQLHEAAAARAPGGDRAAEEPASTGALARRPTDEEDDEDELPWQVIAVLDFGVLNDLRRAFRYHERQIDEALRGVNLPQPGPASLEGCSRPGAWVFKVVRPGGVDVRSGPSPRARCRGHAEEGEYLRAAERCGRWLRLAAREGAERADRGAADWVLLEDAGGRAQLEPVDAASTGDLSVPADEGQAEMFDRPFEPRLRGPEEQPAAEGGDADAEAEGDRLDMQAVERAEEAAASPPPRLAAGMEVLVRDLWGAGLDGMEGVVVAPPVHGRCQVNVRGRPTCTVQAAMLLPRPAQAPEGCRVAGAARRLGLTPAELGLDPRAAGQ
ncbi:unnamed protein product, partial [Prorocentrum cordatum]